nr:hypothetical protein [Tanacetum cinerariifolium]
CQPDNQNVDFFGSDQIQTPQYPDVNPTSPELKYDQSTSTDRPIFLNDNEDHPVQNKESPENSSEQKQKMEDTMFELVKICQEKEFLFIHDDINDLIESALDSKLFLINSNSRHLEKKEQEVKNVVEQPAKQDEIECDMPAKDVCSLVFTTFSNPLFKDNDDLDFSDDESLPDEDVPAEEFKIYSNPLCDEDKINSDKLDPHCFNIESDFVKSLLNRDTFIDFSSKFDFSSELAHIKPEIPKFDFDFEEEIHLIKNLLYDNSFPRPSEELNAEITDTIIESIPLHIPVQDGNSQQKEIDIVTKTDDVLPLSDENDDDLSNDSLLEEDNLIPLGIENVDPEGDIHFMEELLIDDSILSHESSDSNFEDNPSILRPPLEPPDNNFDLEPEVILTVMEDIDEPDEHFNPGGERVKTPFLTLDYFPEIEVYLV